MGNFRVGQKQQGDIGHRAYGDKSDLSGIFPDGSAHKLNGFALGEHRVVVEIGQYLILRYVRLDLRRGDAVRTPGINGKISARPFAYGAHQLSPGGHITGYGGNAQQVAFRLAQQVS